MVFAAPDGSVGRVTAKLLIPYEPLRAGLAHYVEHLAALALLEGKPRDLALDAAYATPHVMAYALKGPMAALPTMLRHLKRVFLPLAVPGTIANSERNIIQREYDLALIDNPDGVAFEQASAFLYEGNANALSVLGSRDEIGALTYDEAKAFHAATHRPERAILVVTGDTSEQALEQATAEAEFPPMAMQSHVHPPAFRFPGEGSRVFSVPQASVGPRMAWRNLAMLPGAVPYGFLVQQCNLLSVVLLSALPGGVPHQLRFDHALAQTIDLAIFPHDERHVEISVWLEPDHGVGFSRLRVALENALAKTAQGIPEPTFKRVHRRFLDDWPKADDQKANAANLLDRLDIRRLPPDPRTLRAVADGLSLQAMNGLLLPLAQPQRLAVSLIGKDVPA